MEKIKLSDSFIPVHKELRASLTKAMIGAGQPRDNSELVVDLAIKAVTNAMDAIETTSELAPTGLVLQVISTALQLAPHLFNKTFEGITECAAADPYCRIVNVG